MEIKKRPEGTLPSDTESPHRPGKEHVKVVTLRSGKTLIENNQVKSHTVPKNKNLEEKAASSTSTNIPQFSNESNKRPLTYAPLHERSDLPLLFPNEPKKVKKNNQIPVSDVPQSGGSHKIPITPVTLETNPEPFLMPNPSLIPTRTPEKDAASSSVARYIPYPQRLRNQKEEQLFKKFLDVLKQVHITLPLVEAIEQIPSYARFLKDILSKKKKLTEYETVSLTKE